MARPLHQKKRLHWEEMIEVVKVQRDAYLSKVAQMERAQESYDYALLLLYAAILPARAKEYHTLQLGKQTSNLPNPRFSPWSCP